jgi:hypothetical protein
MDQKDIKRLKEIAGVLGSALNEVQGLLEKYEEPQPPRKNHRQERIEKYRYKFLSGQMRKRKT